MYHVFIVDKNTFKFHLEYLFAGTGAKEYMSTFLTNSNDTSTHHSTERNLVGMIADVSKIRIGDKIIFYVQATSTEQGKFYGIFKATNTAFFDENDENNFLKSELSKGLSYRINIEPYIVFQEGVTEREYLDNLSDKRYPYELCWSLIYRKLKGNRGCTTITKHEYEDLLIKLSEKNNKSSTPIVKYTFNDEKISINSNQQAVYSGRKNSINIKNRMLYKANKGNAFEVHLQAYILQNFDKNPLKELLIKKLNADIWISNEVSCGVGMQRIDIMIVQEVKNNVFIRIIELKCIEPEEYIVKSQLDWYINWITDYIVPHYINQGKQVNIIPTIIAKHTTKQNALDCINNHKYYNGSLNVIIDPIEFISFTIDNYGIYFSKTI